MKQLLLLFFIFFTKCVCPYPCNQEIDEIFEYSEEMKQYFNSEELSNIEEFLIDPEATELIFTSSKSNISRQRVWSKDEAQENKKRNTRIMQLLKRYDIINKTGTHPKTRNLALTTHPSKNGKPSLFPSCVVKIPKLLAGKKPFQCQNISRMWYNKFINEILTESQLKHIYPVKKCLLHVPMQPTELNDRNYVVVCEKIKPLYTRTQQDEAFQELLLKATRGNRDALRFIAEILFVIKKAGLWDVSLQNVFFVEGNKVAFIDTEKSWKQEKNESFFHKDPSELDNLEKKGITQFSKILCGVPHFIGGKKDQVLEKKGLAIEEKFMQFKGDGDFVSELRSLLPRW